MIPFGKYNGKTIKEVVSKDLQYSQWLITQPWFSIKFIELSHSLLKELNMKLTSESETYDDSFIIYTDGACSNNGKINAIAGIGIYLGGNDKRNGRVWIKNQWLKRIQKFILLVIMAM